MKVAVPESRMAWLLGSCRAVYQFGPFGELLRATGPMAMVNPFRFSTKYQDDETGLLYYGYRYLKKFIRNEFFLFLGYSIDVLIVRYLLLYFDFPEFLDHAPLFDPQYFASSFWMPSLGDLFLNLATTFSIGYWFFHSPLFTPATPYKHPYSRMLLNHAIIIIIFIAFAGLVHYLSHLVAHSSFSYNLADITSISHKLTICNQSLHIRDCLGSTQ